MGHSVWNSALLAQLIDETVSILSQGPRLQMGRCFTDDFIAYVAHEAKEFLIDVEVASIGETGNRHSDRTGVKNYGKAIFAFAHRQFLLVPHGPLSRVVQESLNNTHEYTRGCKKSQSEGVCSLDNWTRTLPVENPEGSSERSNCGCQHSWPHAREQSHNHDDRIEENERRQTGTHEQRKRMANQENRGHAHGGAAVAKKQPEIGALRGLHAIGAVASHIRLPGELSGSGRALFTHFRSACHAFMKLLTLDRDHGEKSDDAFASLSCHIKLIIKLMIPDRDFQKMSLTRDHRF